MTWVGLDVHARSTHGAAIDSLSGELTRVRFGAGREPVVEWLRGLPGPVRAAYEAGPTGFGLQRGGDRGRDRRAGGRAGQDAARRGDRVKTDRKDAELFARLLLAGPLKPVLVPPEWLEAVRHLARTREHVRGDLVRARHRVGKLLLFTAASIPSPTTVEPCASALAGLPALRACSRPSWPSSTSSPRSTA